MQISQFDNIRVVLAEPKADLRKTLKACLHDNGFRSVLDTGNLSQVVNAVKEGNVDLLIADTALAEGDFNEFVKELRHGKHGENPFLVTVTLVDKPSRTAVQAAIDSGTDHVLAKPFDPAALINQVLELTHRRKRFVVTTDYIGPDRRHQLRSDGAMQIPMIDVPNALRQRMTGQVSDGILRRSIEAAKATINEQKVVRHAFQIGWLLDRVLPVLQDPVHSQEVQDNIRRLNAVARDISVRIRSTRYAHVASMCMTLSSMLDQAQKSGYSDHDVAMMAKIATLIEAAFDPERDEISANYRNRRHLIVEKKPADDSVENAEDADFPSFAVA